MNAAGSIPSLNRIDFGPFVWVNIDAPTPEAMGYLSQFHRFHHLDIEDCLSKTQLPKIDEYPEYLFIILHLPRYRKDRKCSVPEQVAFFLGADFLVTVHSGELKPINRLFQTCGADPEALLTRGLNGNTTISPAFLLYRIIHAIIENLMSMLGKVLRNIELIEEKVFDEKVDAVREVTELRHDIANLRRIVMPLGRVIHELERKISRISSQDMSVYFGDLSDFVDRAWAILEECREMIEIYKDTDFVISSDRTNKILTLLTILFTFSIPFSVVGTLYGMNVNLPGGLDRPWTFLGTYTTFILLLLGAFVPVMLMFALFRRLRWL